MCVVCGFAPLCMPTGAATTTAGASNKKRKRAAAAPLLTVGGSTTITSSTNAAVAAANNERSANLRCVPFIQSETRVVWLASKSMAGRILSSHPLCVIRSGTLLLSRARTNNTEDPLSLSARYVPSLSLYLLPFLRAGRELHTCKSSTP